MASSPRLPVRPTRPTLYKGALTSSSAPPCFSTSNFFGVLDDVPIRGATSAEGAFVAEPLGATGSPENRTIGPMNGTLDPYCADPTLRLRAQPHFKYRISVLLDFKHCREMPAGMPRIPGISMADIGAPRPNINPISHLLHQPRDASKKWASFPLTVSALQIPSAESNLNLITPEINFTPQVTSRLPQSSPLPTAVSVVVEPLIAQNMFGETNLEIFTIKKTPGSAYPTHSAGLGSSSRPLVPTEFEDHISLLLEDTFDNWEGNGQPKLINSNVPSLKNPVVDLLKKVVINLPVSPTLGKPPSSRSSVVSSPILQQTQSSSSALAIPAGFSGSAPVSSNPSSLTSTPMHSPSLYHRKFSITSDDYPLIMGEEDTDSAATQKPLAAKPYDEFACREFNPYSRIRHNPPMHPLSDYAGFSPGSVEDGMAFAHYHQYHMQLQNHAYMTASPPIDIVGRKNFPGLLNNSFDSISSASASASAATSFGAPAKSGYLYPEWTEHDEGYSNGARRGSVSSFEGGHVVTTMEGIPCKMLDRSYFYGDMSGEADGVMYIPDRKWKFGVREQYDARNFTIMTYNILAPYFATHQKYGHTDPECLDWDLRRQKILDEIVYHAADFVCLQEVGPADFKDYFLPRLRKVGYDGHFQSKKRGHAADGCAVFYQYARFSLIALEAFAYADQVKVVEPANIDIAARLSPFSNVAMICVFQNNRSRQPHQKYIRIVNTHLHWDPDFADTKLLQSALLLEWLAKTHSDIPTIIAADLNSQPTEPVMEYFLKGRVATKSFGGRDFGKFTTDELLVAPFRFTSAYQKGDLMFTNKTPDFVGTIDHVLYTSDALSLKDVLVGFHVPEPPFTSMGGIKDSGVVFTETGADGEDPGDVAIVPLSLAVSLGDDSVEALDAADSVRLLAPPAMPCEGQAAESGSGSDNGEVKEATALIIDDCLASVTSLPNSVFPSDHIPLIGCFKWKARPRGVYSKDMLSAKDNSLGSSFNMGSPSNFSGNSGNGSMSAASYSANASMMGPPKRRRHRKPRDTTVGGVISGGAERAK